MNRDRKRPERSDDDWEKIAKDLLGVDLSRTQNVDDLDDDPFVPIGASARREEDPPETPPAPAEAAASWEPETSSAPFESVANSPEPVAAWESVDDTPAPTAAASGADEWGAEDDFGAGLGLPSAPRETPKRPAPPPRAERPAPRSEPKEREPRPAPRESAPPRRETPPRTESPAADSTRPASSPESPAEPAERDSFLDALSSWDWSETQGGASASRGREGRDSASRDAEPRSGDRDRPPRVDRGGRRDDRGPRSDSRGEGRSESRRDQDRPPRRDRGGRPAEPRDSEPPEAPRAEEREPVREEPRSEQRRDRDRPRRETARGEGSRGDAPAPRSEGGRSESGPPERRERPSDRPRRREERPSSAVPEDDFGAGLSSGAPEAPREDFEPRRPAGRDAGPRDSSRREEEGRGRRRRGRGPGEGTEPPAPSRPEFGRLTEDDEDIFAPSEPFAGAEPPARPGEPSAAAPPRDDDSGRRGRGRGRDRDRRPARGDEPRSEVPRADSSRAPRREFVDEPAAEDAGVAGWNSDVDEDESGVEPMAFDDLPTWEEAISYLVSAPRERRPEGDRPPRSSGPGGGHRGEGRDRGRRRRN